MSVVVGIVGIGFVGDAIRKSLIQKNIPLKLYDKYKNGGIGNILDLLQCGIVFLCLPTSFKDSLNAYDLTSLHEICAFLSDHNYQGLVVVKSTVCPGTCAALAKSYSLAIVHNPEFLTARTAFADFHNQKHIVIGGANVKLLSNFYSQYYPNAEISICTSNESESMKLFVNSFYAQKIQIFNEFYLLCSKLESCDYDTVKNLMLKNGWINPMHTNVPGHDGQLSYGGACFPKDTRALLACLQKNESSSAVLEACIHERDLMRE